MNINEILAQQFGVSLEDNAQVEVNFNIDTDDNGSPQDGVVEHNTSAPEELPEPDETEDTEVEDSTEEAQAADDEVEQLEEAKDSLEALTAVVNKHVSEGTFSRMGAGFYALALESIVPEAVREQAGCVSLESRRFDSRYHAGLMAQVELEEVARSLDKVSMEAWSDWLRKMMHRVAVVFRQEKALLSRAQKLLGALNSTAEVASEKIIVNGGSKTLSLSYLLGNPWSTDQEFLTKIKRHNDLYISLGTLRNGYEDEFTDLMFPDSRRWPKDRDGKPSYELFGMKLVRLDDVIKGYPAATPNVKTEVPVLSPDVCRSVLESTITLLEMGKVMMHNLNLMYDILEKSEQVETSTSVTRGTTRGNDPTYDTRTNEETVHTKVTYGEGYEEMFETLCELSHLKNKVVFEVLDYVNYSISGSQFI